MSTDSKQQVDEFRGLEHLFEPGFEKLVLANVLVRTDTTPLRILNELEPEDFGTLKFRKVFEASRELLAAGKTPMVSTVASYFIENNNLQAVGGVSGIAEITDEYVELADADWAMRILRRKAIDRQAYRLSVSIQDKCNQGYSLVSDEIQDAGMRLAQLSKAQAPHASERSVGEALAAEGGLDALCARPACMMQTPWHALDEVLNGGLKAGELTILASRPSVGKSTAALQMAYCAVAQGVKVAFYSLEMPRMALIKRLVSSTARVPHDALIRGELDGESRSKIVEALNRIEKYPLAILDDKFKLSDILGDVSKSQPGLVIIDYIGLVETSGRWENRNQEMSSISRRLKQSAQSLGIPFLVLAQLNRLSDVENRRPRCSDLRDSGSLEQDADAVIFLHQPAGLKRGGGNSPKDEVQVLIEKQRNGARDLCVYLQLQGNFCRLVEATQEREN
jgi:replicative DNA helicase